MSDNEKGVPLTVALLTGNGEADSKPIVAVAGKTFEFRLELAAYGGSFDKGRQMWTFPTEEDARAAVADCDRLWKMRATRRGGSA